MTTASPEATVVALDAGAVVRWWQATAFLEVAGPDAPSFLDGLCTQAVERIERGHGVLGLFLDAKAKIIAPTVLHRTADAPWTPPRNGDVVAGAPRLLLETPPDLVAPLAAHLSRYRLRAKVTIEQVELATVALVGAHATEPVGDAVDGAWSRVAGQARPTIAFIGSGEACAELVRTVLPAAGHDLGDPDALEADRIAQGLPGLFDLLPGRMPAEVGAMDGAVALDAGCYLGQEPVARLHYRGHANRTLRRLAADAPIQLGQAPDDGDPAALLELRKPDAAADSRPVGQLTSWARAADGSVRALGVLRREVAAGDELVPSGSPTVLRAVDDAD